MGNVARPCSEKELCDHGAVPESVDVLPVIGSEGALEDESQQDGGGGHTLPLEDLNSRTVLQQVTGQQMATASSARRRITRLSSSSAGMSAEVAEVVSFRGQNSLRRASRLSSVMHSGARILSGQKGSAQTYSMSEKVGTIDTFISHNWSVPRSKKFLCLAMHFNLRSAVLSATAVTIGIAVLQGLGFRPFVLQVETTAPGFESSDLRIEFSPLCVMSATPILLLFALAGHELQWLAGHRGHMVFLDKTCIHQVDMELQQQGIRKLGAFLRSSSQMAVIYTDVYLAKLWTVYEVACYLSLHPQSSVTMLPTFQPVVVFGGAAAFYIAGMITIAVWVLGGPYFLVMGSGATLAISAAVMALRRWALAKESMRKRVTDFQLDKCACACEADRPLVYQNIALLMRAVGEACQEATDEEALDAFNRLVRVRLSRSLSSSIGTIGLTYLQALVPALGLFLPQCLDVAVLGLMPYPEEWKMHFRVFEVSDKVVMTFAVAPLTLAFLSNWCGLCLHLRGWQEFAFLCLGAVIALFCFMVYIMIIFALFWPGVIPGPNRQAFALIMAILYVSPLILVAAVYYRASRPNLEAFYAEDEHGEQTKDRDERTVQEELEWEDDLLRM